jgi:CRISPR-associated endonuclease Csn1
MIRIDVFRENGKYYFVPIYTADVVKKELPNTAITRGASKKNVSDKDFLFSLYSRDLIFIKTRNEKFYGCNQQLQKEAYLYYIGANINTASITAISHDNSHIYESMGVKNMVLLEKCQVDLLGNISVVKSEKRMRFNT